MLVVVCYSQSAVTMQYLVNGIPVLARKQWAWPQKAAIAGHSGSCRFSSALGMKAPFSQALRCRFLN